MPKKKKAKRGKDEGNSVLWTPDFGYQASSWIVWFSG